MKVKLMLAACAATLVMAACHATPTAPSGAQPTAPRADGPGSMGSGGNVDTTGTGKP